MVATAIVFFPAAPLFLFVKGKDITIPKGHEVTVSVNGDVRLEKSLTASSDDPANAQPKVVSSTVAHPVVDSILVKFTSDPAGADVTIDGEYAGSTPLDLRLKEGTRSISIKKRGFVQWERKIHLEIGDHRAVNVDLEPESRDSLSSRVQGSAESK
jgi:hypothetical protein